MRALLVLALAALVACGPAPSVELSRPQPPAPPRDPVKPTTPSTEPGGGDSVATQPTPIPTPAIPRLRIVCADDYAGSLHSISSAARPTDGVPRLDVETEDASEISVFSNPVPVAFGTTRDELVVLIEGVKRVGVSTREVARLMLVTADLTTRKATARDLGARVALSSDVSALAEKVGIQARNFGSSDAGRYLLLPRVKSFDVVSRVTLAKVATLGLDPAKTLMPQIFEGEGLFAALVAEKGSFKIATAKFSVQAGQVGVSAISSLSPVAGATFGAPSWLKPGVLAWTESTNGVVSFVTFETKKASLARARLSMAAGEKASPQMAVVRGAGAPLVVVALETSQALATPVDTSRQLVSGRIAYSNLSPGTATEVLSLPYPANVIRLSKIYGFDGSFAAKRIVAPTGALEAVVAIDVNGLGEMLYKNRAGALDGVGGLECRNPNVIEEVP